MSIYIIGLHRAGTHQFAQYKAQTEQALYFNEGTVDFNSLDCAIALTRGELWKWDWETKKYKVKKAFPAGDKFVAQCPGLSVKAEELSKYGKVYWLTRNHDHVITSMKNANLTLMAWDLMREFRQKWSDDPIWSLIQYEGGKDAYNNFVGYYTLLVKVKEYFYEKYLCEFAEKVVTEEQPYYNQEATVTAIHPLIEREERLVDHYTQHWNEIYESIRPH